MAAFVIAVIRQSSIAVRRREAKELAIETALAEELIFLQNCDDRFLALFRYNDNFDLALLNVENRIRDISLGKNSLILAVFRDRFPGPYFGEK